MGTFGYLQTSSCQNHSSIVEKFASISWHKDDTQFHLSKSTAHPAIDLRIGSSYNFFLVKLPVGDGPPSAGQGWILDQYWIRPGLLKEWKYACQYIHGATCDAIVARKTALTGRPKFLVDTSSRSIVRAKPTQSYVALSYVWGRCKQLRTLKDNLESLQQENSLNNPEWAAMIPQTIRDAIRIVETLDERYLWVDALCIVQDDEDEKHSQINDMAAIYANASLTIVATHKNAAVGLEGIEGITGPRCFRQEVFTLGDQSRFIYSPVVPIARSTWSSRGWTFQESLLSQRKIIFCGDRVQWQCLCAVWNEDIELDNSITPVHSRGRRQDGLEIMFHNLLTCPWPNLHTYGKLVAEYSDKSLTYPEDIVSAFSGLTSALANRFKGGFIFGIPEMFFDVGLLWGGTKSLERRTNFHTQKITEIPSWSWMGWKGGIYGPSWFTGLHYIKKNQFMWDIFTSRKTKPLVQWYNGDKANPRRRALKTFSTCTSFADIGAANLEPGWTCHPNTAKQHLKPWNHWDIGDDGKTWHHVSGCHDRREPDYYYKHESDPEAEFWTPVPICRDIVKHTLDALMPLISCTTQRAFFYPNGEKFGTYQSSLPICTRSGAWAGCLELEPYPKAHVTIPDPPYELVAISEGFAFNDNHEYYMDEWSCKERPRLGEKYEFYNVMWISWFDGIAYRNAIGRVPKEIWDNEELETIDLVLG